MNLGMNFYVCSVAKVLRRDVRVQKKPLQYQRELSPEFDSVICCRSLHMPVSVGIQFSSPDKIHRMADGICD